MDLNGKTVIVTGAARGIGLGIAQAFGREGANIVLADLGSLHSGEWTYELSSTKQLEVAVESVAEQGSKAIAAEVDVSKRNSVHRLVAQARESFGSVDIVVNNAGVVKAGGFANYDEKSWDQTFAVNVKGTFLVSQAAVAVMLENGGGAIITIGSCQRLRFEYFLTIQFKGKSTCTSFTTTIRVFFVRHANISFKSSIWCWTTC